MLKGLEGRTWGGRKGRMMDREVVERREGWMGWRKGRWRRVNGERRTHEGSDERVRGGAWRE